jgi:hypothetical protein
LTLKPGEPELRRFVRWLRRDPKILLRFDDRRYKLGESIDITVEIYASRDFRLTEALIDLVHERRYIENSSMMVPDYMTARVNLRSPLAGRRVLVPKRVTQHLIDHYLHSSVTFANECHLDAGSHHSYSVRLAIQPHVPPHCGEGITKWLLKVVLRLPNGRGVIHAEQISISLV